MREPTKIWTFFLLVLWGQFLPATAHAGLMYDVVVNGTRVGTVEATAGDGAVIATFDINSSLFSSLEEAAKFCGEDHFNWYQQVTSATHRPVDRDGKPLVPPFNDPPSGGYGNDPATPGNDTLWADTLPYYWNEGAAPPDGTPGFKDGYHLDDHTTRTTLDFIDKPASPFADQEITFITYLASVNKDGSLHGYHGGFTWSWKNTGGGESQTISSFQAIPEPSSLVLFSTAMCSLLWFAKRRKTG